MVGVTAMAGDGVFEEALVLGMARAGVMAEASAREDITLAGAEAMRRCMARLIPWTPPRRPVCSRLRPIP